MCARLNPHNRIVGTSLTFWRQHQRCIEFGQIINYDIAPSFVPGGNKVIGLSYDGASFHKTSSGFRSSGLLG